MTKLQRDETFELSSVSGNYNSITNENVWPLVPPGRSNADMMER